MSLLLWVCSGLFFLGTSGLRAPGRRRRVAQLGYTPGSAPLLLALEPLRGIRPSFSRMTSLPWGPGLFN